MLAVGFDLYCQLLEEAVQKLKLQRGEALPAAAPAAAPVMAPVELMVDTFLSDEYIPDAALKMEIYQRMMAARELDEVNDIASEMVDRYGRPPAAAQNLLGLARVRLLAQEIGVTGVQQKGKEVELKLGSTITCAARSCCS
jgi:transcription-repair coupling factor (superfamily II helicase)